MCVSSTVYPTPTTPWAPTLNWNMQLKVVSVNITPRTLSGHPDWEQLLQLQSKWFITFKFKNKNTVYQT